MPAPQLDIRARAQAPVPGIEAFPVVQGGEFAGRWFAAGELVLCRGDAHNGDATVLVAQGLGRPRLGSRRNGRWLGDGGEPCAAERWRSAGRLVGRARRSGPGWVVDLFGDAEVPEVVAPIEQLSLFAAA